MSVSTELHRERHWTCARRISERRHDLGLTQCDVVERLATLGVGATNRSLSAMEHGQGLDIGRLPEIATALDCTITYLLGLTEHPHRWAPDDAQTPVTVERPAASAPRGWILGPDVPDRTSAGA
jgi:transcriptional regulator with XRE-family HTH domain